jgi:hypothetical protein
MSSRKAVKFKTLMALQWRVPQDGGALYWSGYGDAKRQQKSKI